MSTTFYEFDEKRMSPDVAGQIVRPSHTAKRVDDPPLPCMGEETVQRASWSVSYYREASEDQLLFAARSGAEQAFAELCRRHSPATKRRILRIVRNWEDAEDVLQETLLRAYTHLGRFRGSCKFSTWITCIGVNAALMLLRKRRARPESAASLGNDDTTMWETDCSPNPEQFLTKRQTCMVLEKEVQRLRPAFRDIIDTYYRSESSLEESASALGISVPAAKARLFRGRTKLRSSLARYGVLNSGV